LRERVQPTPQSSAPNPQPVAASPFSFRGDTLVPSTPTMTVNTRQALQALMPAFQTEMTVEIGKQPKHINVAPSPTMTINTREALDQVMQYFHESLDTTKVHYSDYLSPME